MSDLLTDPRELSKALLEIAFLFAVFYYLLKFMRGTRAAGIIRGFIFLCVFAFVIVMWLTQIFQLVHIRWILEWILPYLALTLIVIFQPELRRALTLLGQNPFMERFMARESSVLDEIEKAATRLSKKRHGALIAIEREVSLGGYIEGGVRLDAEVSSEAIETIFYPGTPLHDGAIILQNDRVAAAGCLFPLSDNPDIAKTLGTRHRAGIGITEESDSITVIVSEETGAISVGSGGRLTHDVDRESLRRLLRDLLTRAPLPPPGERGAPAEERNA
ncbi:MAG: TIGR00159 family protein [Planctomycetes bacterium]|nr:TIGR00159 family protein [Planctomycetota bacterium]